VPFLPNTQNGPDFPIRPEAPVLNIRELVNSETITEQDTDYSPPPNGQHHSETGPRNGTPPCHPSACPRLPISTQTPRVEKKYWDTSFSNRFGYSESPIETVKNTGCVLIIAPKCYLTPPNIHPALMDSDHSKTPLLPRPRTLPLLLPPTDTPTIMGQDTWECKAPHTSGLPLSATLKKFPHVGKIFAACPH